MTENKAKMAGHAPTALTDNAAIGLIQFILCTHGKVADRLYAYDSWPNIDGYVEVLDDDGQPIGTIWAQVKTLPENHGLKFSCPTGLFEFVTHNRPIFLFGADLQEEKIYWNYYDEDIVVKLPYANQKTLTVEFDPYRSFTRQDTRYVEAWRQLVIERKTRGKPEARGGSQLLPSPLSFDEQIVKDIYYAKLLADPSITDIQVLKNLPYPISVSNTYIKQRVREQTRLSYQLDPKLQKAHDPLSLMALQERQRKQQSSLAKDPVDVLRTSRYKRFVIVGGAGTGKTTLLKYLTLLSLKREQETLPSLPIFVNLNKFAVSGESDLQTFILQTWEQNYNISRTDGASLLIVHLQRGDALLLFDALDEAVVGENEEAAEASYQRVAQSIQGFCTRYEKALMVITARKESYRLRIKLAGFAELELLDFNALEIHLFLQKWFAQSSDPQKRILASRLQKLFEQNLRISTLAANPLLLTLIAFLFEDQLSLPDRRAMLYCECVDVLLSKWDKTKHNLQRRRVFQPDLQKQLLSEIAWHFHCQGLRYSPKKELLPLIRIFLQKKQIKSLAANLILEDITGENGLLREQAHDLYGFLHLTLQEYFTAQYLINQKDLDLLLQYLGSPSWDEVVLLYAEHIDDASHLMSYLISSDAQDEHAEDIFFTKLTLAGRCLARCSSMDQVHLREEIIHSLFETLLHTPYSLIREQAAGTLAEIARSYPEASLNERLLNLLAKNQSDEMRRTVAGAIRSAGPVSLKKMVFPLFLDKDNWKIKSDLEDILSSVEDPAVISSLLAYMLSESTDQWIRSSIAHILCKTGNPLIIRALLSLVVNQQTPVLVRMAITLALGSVTQADLSVVQTLLSLLYDPETDSPIAVNCVNSLMRLGDRSVVADLVALLSNTCIYEGARKHITDALDELGDHTLTEQLLPLLSQTQIEAEVRAEIAASLIKHSNHKVDRDLFKMLADEEVATPIRRTIAWAFGTRSDHSVVPPLWEIFKQPIHPDVRRTITFALCSQGEYTALAELEQLFRQAQFPDGMIQQVIDVFLKYADPSLTLGILSDAQIDQETRKKIAASIGETANAAFVSDLLHLLSQSTIEENIRVKIAETIGKLASDEQSVQRLLDQWLKDRESSLGDVIHRAMWAVSRRAGVTVTQQETNFRIVSRAF